MNKFISFRKNISLFDKKREKNLEDSNFEIMKKSTHLQLCREKVFCNQATHQHRRLVVQLNYVFLNVSHEIHFSVNRLSQWKQSSGVLQSHKRRLFEWIRAKKLRLILQQMKVNFQQIVSNEKRSGHKLLTLIETFNEYSFLSANCITTSKSALDFSLLL